MSEKLKPATNAQIKEIYARNIHLPRTIRLRAGKRSKTVGLAAVYIDELDSLLERIRLAEEAASQSAPAPPEGDYDTLRIEAEYLAGKVARLEAAAALSSGWRSMESVPRKGNVLLDLGETIPGTPNARVGKFISEAEAATFHETLSSAGGWMIWNADDDWFVVPFADAVGWMPLPTPQGEQG